MANIVVVEDDKDLAWTMMQLLSSDGHEVRVANDGEEAMRLLDAGLPDLVVTDIEMPALSGEGLGSRMFTEDCGRECIPIIIISGFPELDLIARRMGTPYYLSKPYAIDEVLGLINRALNERIAPKGTGSSKADALSRSS